MSPNMAVQALLLILSAVTGLSSAQTGVCYQTRSYTRYREVYVSTSHQSSYGCWISRCYRTRYRSQRQTRSYATYYSQFGCCGGYRQRGSSQECIPICYNCDSNHICIAPYTCVCPEGWMGEDCSEDINECEISNTCEQNCANNNGSYSCSCTTGYSLASDLRGCLGPPENVSVFADSPTTVQIYWDPPVLDSWDGYIQLYEISCSSPSGWGRNFAESPFYNHYQVYSLTPFSNYTCCVAAHTTNGLSSSSCSYNMTLEDSPLDSPQNITVVNTSAFALLIEWNPPNTPNGVITLYNIYIAYDNKSETNFTVSNAENSYLLEGLSPHQLVYVSMSASTVAGEGPSSVTVHARTNQAVPTGVTDLQLKPLSLHQIEITWQPPETHNGILTGYVVTVYNSKINYTKSFFVGPDVLNTTVSDNIGPFIPYTVDVQAFTHAGGGIIEKEITFTQEGVPEISPQISNLSREDATTGELSWNQLTLDELRGFLHSYIVVYRKIERYTCADIDMEGGETFAVMTESAVITSLSPAVEYCVGVAASTAAGVGNYSHALLPVYNNFLFQIHFLGVHNCPQWVNDNSLEKISHFVDKISEELSGICNCFLPNDYIGDTRMVCNEETPNNVVFQGRVIGTRERNVSELMQDMTQWVITGPHVVVQGVQLIANMNCSIELYELGDSKCAKIQNKKQEGESQADNAPLVPIVVGTNVPLVLLALIVLTTCGIILLRKKKMKLTPTHVLDSPPALPSSEGLPMCAPLEEHAYKVPCNACPEDYESVDPGKGEDENIYEAIPSQT